MWEYRAYLIGLDGHIVRRVDLLCDQDEAAKAQFRWHPHRRVMAGRPFGRNASYQALRMNINCDPLSIFETFYRFRLLSSIIDQTSATIYD